jgi:hypothetical protein
MEWSMEEEKKKKRNKKPSFKAAITAKCKECIYDEYARGTWRKQIEDCTSVNCPLHPVRPKSSYSKPNPDETKV